MTSEGRKSAVESYGVWGGIVALFSSLVGIVQDPAILAIIPGQVVPYIGAVGAVIGIIGRVKAKKSITSVLPK